jgi:hypothetical protein
MPDLTRALALIDDANAADPSAPEGRPAALLYGQRMSEELARQVPAAGDVLQVAARGQHIERWLLPRAAYPEGKAGYLEWRREQARRHGTRLAEILAAAGYGDADQARVGVLVRKEGLKRDAEVQALEDVICFVFMRHYLPAFAAGRDRTEVVEIVAKTARKMSAAARARALDTLSLPDDLAEALRSAG